MNLGDDTELSIGSTAPDFTLPSSHGEQVELTALAGRPILLVFFPYAFTGVCTGELRALAGQHQAMTATGAAVFAVSTDTRYALRVFAEREQLPFTMLSDFWPHGAVAQRYHCFDAERGCAERASYVLDAEQQIRWTTRSGFGTARDISAQVQALAALDPRRRHG